MVLRQGLLGKPLEQILRLGTSKQFSPLPLGFQLSQQEMRESVLLRLREFGRFAEGPLKKLTNHVSP